MFSSLQIYSARMVGVHESLDFCTVLGWVINLNKEGNLYHSAYIITQCLHRKCDLCDLCISESFHCTLSEGEFLLLLQMGAVLYTTTATTETEHPHT